MQNQIVIQHDPLALANEAALVSEAPAVGYIASSSIHFLSRVVSQMEPHPDSGEIGTARGFLLGTIQQSRADPLSPELGKNVKVLDLWNLQVRESRIGGTPVNGDVPGEPAAEDCHPTNACARRFLGQITLVLCHGFAPTDALEGSGHHRRIGAA